MPGLDALTQTSEHALAARLDGESAKALTAYLRTNPQALLAQLAVLLAAVVAFVINVRSARPSRAESA